MDPAQQREQARSIWQAAVDAVRPHDLLQVAFADPTLGLRQLVESAVRVLVLGAGKASAGMAAAVEEFLVDQGKDVEGLVNVPAEALGHRPAPRHIALHPARSACSNQPTAAGVAGARRILQLAQGARADEVGLCLLSGGASALLPAPAEGLSLEDKQQVTSLLHACGATINEMNAVRKHLSAIKGGRLASTFAGRALVALVISDVVGDRLDVIGSGPTVADPTTFADALAVLDRYGLTGRAPVAVLTHLRRGAAGELPETPKVLPSHVRNHVIGNNATALTAARRRAEALGYPVLNLGSFMEGEARHVARALAGLVRSIRRDRLPLPPPVCLLSGGETTVTLGPGHGRGGRNQEFVLSALCALGADGLAAAVVLSGGTDGEDGPTDAAGALADRATLERATNLRLDPRAFLDRNDSYSFFAATGDLLKTGLTGTNVMDVQVILVP